MAIVRSRLLDFMV